MSFAFEKTVHISLICKLAPVQYREYELVTSLFVSALMQDKDKSDINLYVFLFSQLTDSLTQYIIRSSTVPSRSLCSCVGKLWKVFRWT